MQTVVATDGKGQVNAPAHLRGTETGGLTAEEAFIELDYLAREKIKLSLQYTGITQFNGSTSNYDEFSRHAFDNTIFYLAININF